MPPDIYQQTFVDTYAKVAFAKLYALQRQVGDHPRHLAERR
jgi:hypothetical protein